MGRIWATVSTVRLKKKTESAFLGIQSFSPNFCSNPNYKTQLLTTQRGSLPSAPQTASHAGSLQEVDVGATLRGLRPLSTTALNVINL